MKKLLKNICLAIILVLSFSLIACSQKTTPKEDTKTANKTETRHIKIGCVSTTQPAAQLIKEAIEKGSNTAELVMFDGNNLPAIALKDGSIDAVFANHLPWIKTFNKENNADIGMVQPYFYYSPFRIYSTKYKSIEELPNNAKIILPNDPANQDRSIRMMSECKLVKLGEKKGNFYTKLDIVENPKKIQFTEVEVTSTARNVRDVDAAFSMAFIAQKAGKIDPKVYLYEDTQSSNYPMGLLVKAKDVDEKWAVDAMKLLKTDENKAKFNETFKGAFTLFN
ncbi:MAG: MetQ/NlpA family ABC transporter substrate-binding protein [Clostridium sp.]|uniref:MetQ/NlpA family ABC transporter substrate-binding protein n=1 Tax=Clostridium sp. TaxID=1506 RepID=UPI003D6CC116